MKGLKMLKDKLIKIRDNTDDDFTKEVAIKLLNNNFYMDNDKECRMFIYRHRKLLK